MTQLKTCTKCLEAKPLEMFSLCSRNKTDGRQPKCKACYQAYRAANLQTLAEKKKVYYSEHKDEIKARVSEWQRAHPEHRRVTRAKWIARNHEQMKAIRLQWAKANPHKVQELTRKSQIPDSAIPMWADEEDLSVVYAEAIRLTQETGILHTVDHIVPIKSKLVCGLHCRANLQVLTLSENCKKSNSRWPDMP